MKNYDRLFPKIEEKEKYESMSQLVDIYINLMDAVDEFSKEYSMRYEDAWDWMESSADYLLRHPEEE